jgi:DNA invertase Pin-like site-specific DNA recombinase
MLNGTDQTAKPYDIYARVSRVKSKKKNEPSTGGQVAICRLRLADLDLPEGKVLVDPGRSAWDPTVRRPSWDELMDRLERGVSGGFIVFDLERFTRQPKDAERMIELAARGLGVLDSESEYDLTTPSGKKAFRDAINAAGNVGGTEHHNPAIRLRRRFRDRARSRSRDHPRTDAAVLGGRTAARAGT